MMHPFPYHRPHLQQRRNHHYHNDNGSLLLTFSFIIFIVSLTLSSLPLQVDAKCVDTSCSGHGTCVIAILNTNSSFSSATVLIEPTADIDNAHAWCQCNSDWRGDMITSDCIVHTPDLIPLYVVLLIPSLYNIWIAQSRLRGAIVMWRTLQRSMAHAIAANNVSPTHNISLWRQPMFRFALGSIFNSLLMIALYMLVAFGGYVPVRDWPPTIIMAITQSHFYIK
jgi:hypothetical protein